MTQDEIVRKVHAEVQELDKIRLNLKETKVVIDAYLSLAADVLEGEGRIVVPHIGIFKTKEQKERKGHNPQTGEKITIPAQIRVKFTPAKSLKDAVNS